MALEFLTRLADLDCLFLHAPDSPDFGVGLLYKLVLWWVQEEQLFSVCPAFSCNNGHDGFQALSL